MGQTGQPNITSDDLIKCAKWLFEEFCTQHNIAPELRVRAQPSWFFEWFVTEKAPTLNPQNVANDLDISLDSASYVIGLASSPIGPNRMMGLWPHMTLGDRKAKHPVLSVAMALLLQWKDGTVCALTQVAHADTQPNPILDAEVSQLVITKTPDLNNMFVQTGLDYLHDKNTNFVGCVSPEVIGWLEAAIERYADAETEDRSKDEQEAMGDKAKQAVEWLRGVFPHAISGSVRMAMNKGATEVETTPQPADPNESGWQRP